jgi:hypothetical protein
MEISGTQSIKQTDLPKDMYCTSSKFVIFMLTKIIDFRFPKNLK